MTLAELNALAPEAAYDALERCCGARAWIEGMVALRPFADARALFAAAERVWNALGPDDWREAFRHHPQIGERAALRARFASTATWASSEQAGTAAASNEVLDALAEGNHAYVERFGWIFIVYATGKSASEMLAALQARLNNDPASELPIAAAEQAKITRLRLEKLLSP